MIRDYELARKKGRKAVRAAARNNTTEYLPVFDLLAASKNIFKEVRAGLMELPVNRIIGTKETSRRNAFAANFMPLHGLDSEFAYKWSYLYDAVAADGIRDAIKVYEYMHKYYVQEGNKRVSVSKYYKIDFLLADVIRMVPEDDGSEEVKAYYEYLDFYNVTKNYYIAFNKPGQYARLAELLGENLNEKWSEENCLHLTTAYFRFIKGFKSVVKTEDDFAICNAFLDFISKFSFESLLNDLDKQIKKNIKIFVKENKTVQKQYQPQIETPVFSVKSFGFRNVIESFRKAVL